jgi:hypothetical protein
MGVLGWQPSGRPIGQPWCWSIVPGQDPSISWKGGVELTPRSEEGSVGRIPTVISGYLLFSRAILKLIVAIVFIVSLVVAPSSRAVSREKLGAL